MFIAQKVTILFDAAEIVRKAQAGELPDLKASFFDPEAGATWVVFTDGSCIEVTGPSVIWYPTLDKGTLL